MRLQSATWLTVTCELSKQWWPFTNRWTK